MSKRESTPGSKPKAPAKRKPEAEKFPRKVPILFIGKGDTEEVAAKKYAGLVTSPELAASRAIRAADAHTAIGEGTDVPTLLETLRDLAAAVNRGDLSHAEAMLMNQASALQSLFARLAERSMGCTNLTQFEVDMRIALRAQSQCRATLETLAAIKNPPIIYARQANVTTGPQQVNNGMPASSRAREIESEPNQLSEGSIELLPDTRASGDASRVNPALEALEEIDRPKVAGR
jgi:hypothetical protein